MTSISSQNPTDAISIQVQQRVDHTIRSLLPRMHGLAILITESATLSRTHDITEFQNTIQTINNNLDIALQASDAASSVIHSRSDIVIPFTSVGEGKRKHHAVSQLLPPSPEAKQLRKTSHDTMQ